jgi:hypothetical protein
MLRAFAPPSGCSRSILLDGGLAFFSSLASAFTIAMKPQYLTLTVPSVAMSCSQDAKQNSTSLPIKPKLKHQTLGRASLNNYIFWNLHEQQCSHQL